MGEDATSKCETNNPKGHIWLQWAMAILVNLTIFTYGLQLAWLSPMIKLLQSAESPLGRPLSDTEISFIAAVPSLAAMIGIILMLLVVDTFGRRYAVLIMTIFQTISWIIKLCPSNYTSLIVARVFCGLGAAGCFTVAPLYIKEVSQDNIRGTLGSIGTLFQNLGIMIIYSLGGYFSYTTVLYIVVGIPFLNMILLVKAVESPSFLVKKGKFEEAAANVAILRGLSVNDTQVANEIESLRSENDYFKSIPNISFYNIYKVKAWRRGFIIALMIFVAHALNGSFGIINYASIVLANSDVEISPELLSLVFPVALTIGTLFTMSSVDRLGRKVLLGGAFLVTAMTFFVLASIILLRSYRFYIPGWVSIAAIVLIVFCYGAGVGPVPYIVVSEIFNFQVRAKLLSLLSILTWSMTFTQLVSFTAITGALGLHTTFFIFGVINLLGLLIIITVLPETTGKKVHQIEEELKNSKKAVKQHGNC